ncbi:beta-propeller fold lactonase family protein [Clostridium sp. AM58-1XD]|uniref:beta-propeller fold lactonase family protein n=1 Tax=Clostridium sp. AM58-1XD TaxID=2292307 RepID=UPI0015F41052|nr:beta-propeller fold lactonase family protein [Clostridium sp. AM58-1XD]
MGSQIEECFLIGRDDGLYEISFQRGRTETIQWIQKISEARPDCITVLREMGSTTICYAAFGNKILSFKQKGFEGRWEKTGESASGGGEASCILALSDKHCLIAANGRSGLITAIHLNQDGSIGSIQDQKPLPGRHGPDRRRQLWSYAGGLAADFDGTGFFVCNQGNDMITMAEIEKNGKIIFGSSISLRPASCPSEIMTAEGKHVVLALSNGIESITCFKYGEKSLIPFQIVQPLPQYYTGLNVSCHHMLCGEHYAVWLCDGLDCAAVFQVNDGLRNGKWIPFSVGAEGGLKIAGKRAMCRDERDRDAFWIGGEKEIWRIEAGTGDAVRWSSPEFEGIVCLFHMGKGS